MYPFITVYFVILSYFRDEDELMVIDQDYGRPEVDMDFESVSTGPKKSSKLVNGETEKPGGVSYYDGGLTDRLLFWKRHLADQLDRVKIGDCSKLVWGATEVREHLRILWTRDATILKILFPLFDEVNF